MILGLFHAKTQRSEDAAQRRRSAVTRSEDAPRRTLFEVPIGREKNFKPIFSNLYIATGIFGHRRRRCICEEINIRGEFWNGG